MRRLLLAASILFSLGMAHAATKEVATSGTDTPGCGTVGTPCATPWYCANQLSGGGGDTCNVHVGTYTSVGGPIINVGGAPGIPNTIKGAGDGDAVIKPSVITDNTLRIGANDLLFQGLRVRGSVRYIDAPEYGSRTEWTRNVMQCPGPGDSTASNYGYFFSESLGTGLTNYHEDIYIHDNLFDYSSSAACPTVTLGSGINFTHFYHTRRLRIQRNDFRVSTTVLAPNGKIMQGVGLKVCNELADISENYFTVSGGGIVDKMLWEGTNPAAGGFSVQCPNLVGRNAWHNNLADIKAGGAVSIFISSEPLGQYDSSGIFYNNTASGVGALVDNDPDDALPSVSGTMQVFNNIHYNGTAYHQRWEDEEGLAAASYVDRNIYYPEAVTGAEFRVCTAVFVCTDYTTYADWKTAVSPKDQASTLADPAFVSAGAGNFRLQAGSPAATGGRGGSFPTYRGAYSVAGTETIGCSFQSGCFSFGTGSVCGNGIVETGEQCDGADLAGEDCESQGFDEGTLACGTSGPTACKFVTTSCCRCGDGVVGCTETCDGNTAHCEDIDPLYDNTHDAGCLSYCEWDTSTCTSAAVYGNGVIEFPEQCDTGNLNGEDCASQGFDGGTLACATPGEFVVSGCTATTPDVTICAVKPKRPGDEIIDDDLLNVIQVNLFVKDLFPVDADHVDETALQPWYDAIAAAHTPKRLLLAINYNAADKGHNQKMVPAWFEATCPLIHVLGYTDSVTGVVYGDSQYIPVWWHSGCEEPAKHIARTLTAHFANDPRIIGFFPTGYSDLFPISLAGEQTIQTCKPTARGGTGLGWQDYGYTIPCFTTDGGVEQSRALGSDPYGPMVRRVITEWATHVASNQILLYSERNISVDSLTDDIYHLISSIYPRIASTQNGFRPFEELADQISRWQGLQASGHHAGWNSISKNGFGSCDDRECSISGTNCKTEPCGTGQGTCEPVCSPTCSGTTLCPGVLAAAIRSSFGALRDNKTIFELATKSWNQNVDAKQECFRAGHPIAPWRGVSIRGYGQ